MARDRTQAFGILDDNDWVCAATMINGLPGETQRCDQDIELVEELKSIATKSLIIPMNFVSMRGSSSIVTRHYAKKMTPEHWQLMGECLDHDFHVVHNYCDVLIKMAADW